MMRAAFVAHRHVLARGSRAIGGWTRVGSSARAFSTQRPTSQDVLTVCVGAALVISHLSNAIGSVWGTIPDREKAEAQKDELARRHPVKEDLRRVAQKEFDLCLEAERRKDVRAVYPPFDDQDALTDALRGTLLVQGQSFDAGVIVIAAARGAGTRVRHVCHSLAKEGKIRGAIFVDFAKGHDLSHRAEVDIRDSFWGKLNADPSLTMYDVMSSAKTGNDLTVVILDNVDFPTNQEDVKRLCRELAMASAQPEGVNKRFIVLATCCSPDTARLLLDINGGKKVRALAYGKTLVHGDSTLPPDSWLHRGLKWSRTDCDRLVKAFEQEWKLTLDDHARKVLLDLAEKAGTPDFVRDVFTRAQADRMLRTSGFADYVQKNFEDAALDSAAEWEQIAKLEKPSTRPL